MSDFETRREERRKWRDEQRQKVRDKWGQQGGVYSGHSRGSIWTGVFILVIGIAALIKTSVPNLPPWLFTWPTFLIGLGLFIGLRHNFRGVAWFILIAVGIVFLYDRMNPDIAMRRFLWPMIMIVVGLFFILRPRRRWSEKKNAGVPSTDPILGAPETFSDEDYVDSTSIFGGAKKNIISKNFRGGDLVNIFGGTDLDLTQADFTGTSVIELTTIFGGTKLIVPSNWSIKSEAVIIFGGLEDKRRMQTVTDNPDKTLILKGTVIFGGIEIKSY
jgi:predicted membrane protein